MTASHDERAVLLCAHLVYQVSDERQNVVTMESPNRDPNREVVLAAQPGGTEAEAASPAPSEPLLSRSQEQGANSLGVPQRVTQVFSGHRCIAGPFEIVLPESAECSLRTLSGIRSRMM